MILRVIEKEVQYLNNFLKLGQSNKIILNKIKHLNGLSVDKSILNLAKV